MKVNIGNNEFNVKVCDTPKKQREGMQHKTFDESFNGMLFIMPSRTQQSFWMFECITQLDIIMIDGDTITRIHHDCLPCDVEEACEEFTGFGDRVLELEGGTCERLNIKEGNLIRTTLY